MISIFDDRISRQQNILKEEKLNDLFHLANSNAINEFQQNAKEKLFDKIFIKDYTVFCFHGSSLFDDKGIDRESIIKEAEKRKLPVVLFSGGFSFASTIKQGVVYTMDVSLFYKRVKEYDDDTIDLEKFLFGENHKLNKLLRLRRKLRAYSRGNRLEEFLGIRYQYQNEEIKSFFSQVAKLEHSNDFTFNNINNILSDIISHEHK
jgi:hypothetical protein